MGAISKLFGGRPSVPKVEPVAPAPTTIASGEVEDTSGEGSKKRRRGFASTQTSTIAGDAGSGRSTLG
jgi:hypothetical protein|nr:MAG TPA: Dynamin family [Caudoviricetes sp.]